MRTMWRVPTKSVEPKLGAATEERVKKMKAWSENKGVKWNDLVQQSALFTAGLGPQPTGGDLAPVELEARRKAQEAEDRTIFAKAQKFKETQLGPPPKSIVREGIRPRLKLLRKKDLGSFEPRPPLVDPVKERANKEGEGLKKKKKKRVTPEGASDMPGSKRMRVGGEVTPMAEEAGEKGVGATSERVVAPEVQGDEGQGGQEEETHMSAMPKMQVKSGSADPEEVMELQPKGGPAPQKEVVKLKHAIYHAPAVAGRLEGEEGPARTTANLLLGVVNEVAVRSTTKFNEAELLRGLCSAQMEATTLAGALLRKAAAAKGEVKPLKAKLEEAKAQLESLRSETAGWRRTARSVCARGLKEAQKAQKMEVLAIVQRNVVARAHTELLAVKLELEDEGRKVVSLEFQLAGEQKKLGDAQNACTVATERFEEAMISNEELRPANQRKR
ncbi:hypothetical protein CsSME_00024161 [Camellia sinensis var. sinensis]